MRDDAPLPQPDRAPSSISACMVCRNEGDRLVPCLESLAWVDEIIVMDLSSTDDSATIAARHGARVIIREPVPIVELVRNDVAAVAHGEWILVMDPDERVTPGLARALREVASDARYDAVVIPRMNYDLGFPPSNPLHRYEPQLRMYRRSAVTWPTIPNALPVVPGDRLFRVPQRDDLVLVHDRSRNIPEVVDRVLRYAPLQAQSMIDRGQVFTAKAMLAAMGGHIKKQFIRGQPWKDGVPGVLRASLLVAFHFYIWAAFWQLSGVGRTPDDDRLMMRLGRMIEGGRWVMRTGKAPFTLARRLFGR